jgi:DNA-binding GntR family transcriptional regulator
VSEVAATIDNPDISGSDRCLSQIRSMVLSGELLPGQKLNQWELANHLKVSRIPIREALSKLQSEGLVEHKPNTGWKVARFNSDDLSEIYLMRRLLETELLQTADLKAVDLDRMTLLLEQMKTVSPAESPELYQQLNMDFHFAVLDSSPQRLIRQEVGRLWYMSSFYRTLYIHAPETSGRLHTEHQRLIAAVKSRNVRRLIEISDKHRSGTQQMIEQRLGHTAPRR